MPNFIHIIEDKNLTKEGKDTELFLLYNNVLNRKEAD